jgi:drug/metabolite transporter (DMT)-like permease
MPITFALISALTYGVADFAGGLAARRAPVLVVTAVAQVTGLLMLVPAVMLLPGVVTPAALGFGALAGIAGAGGVMLYLRALAVGPMGLVAPLSAVAGAGLPLIVGLVGGERPGAVAGLALAAALGAIVLATAGSRHDAAAGTGLLLGFGAGLGFGLFFVGLDLTPAGSGLWPLLAGRVVSVALLLAVLVAIALPAIRLPRRPPPALGAMILSGALDVVANVAFLLATRSGALSVSGVLVSLYPVVVVVLAWVVLRERLTGLQLTGVGLALTASALLAAAT